MRKTGLVLIIFSLLVTNARGQENIHSMGVPETVDSQLLQLKEKTTLISANYKSLGSSASLKKYCPTPGNQDPYSTCAAWSTAFAARTIVEAERNGWTDKSVINAHTFSPIFIYRLNDPNDYNCSRGAHPADLLELMQQNGVPYFSDFKVPCQTPGATDFANAKPNRINNLQRVFYLEPYQGYEVSTESILKIKKSIDDGNPVVISIVCPPSFHYAKDVWQPYESALIVNNKKHGRHAICIVGFDDDKYGGAFEIMNSWGTTDWGNGGFTWIPYESFKKFCYAAVELVKFEKKETLSKLSGSVQFLNVDNSAMTASQVSGYHYKLNNSYSSGTRFKIFVNNTEPTNMFVIGADSKGNYSTLFPYSGAVSPLLNFANSTVAIPGENKHIRMDNTIGQDYMLIIYTKNKDYDIDKVIKQLKVAGGDFPQKVATVLKSTIENNKISYQSKKVAFQSSEAQKGDVILLVEIDHVQ